MNLSYKTYHRLKGYDSHINNKRQALTNLLPKNFQKAFVDHPPLVSGNRNEIKWLSSLINVLITNQAEVIDES